jgi:hypothetical protein
MTNKIEYTYKPDVLKTLVKDCLESLYSEYESLDKEWQAESKRLNEERDQIVTKWHEDNKYVFEKIVTYLTDVGEGWCKKYRKDTLKWTERERVIKELLEKHANPTRMELIIRFITLGWSSRRQYSNIKKMIKQNRELDNELNTRDEYVVMNWIDSGDFKKELVDTDIFQAHIRHNSRRDDFKEGVRILFTSPRGYMNEDGWNREGYSMEPVLLQRGGDWHNQLHANDRRLQKIQHLAGRKDVLTKLLNTLQSEQEWVTVDDIVAQILTGCGRG